MNRGASLCVCQIQINGCSANAILVSKSIDFVSVVFLAKANVYKAAETLRMVKDELVRYVCRWKLKEKLKGQIRSCFLFSATLEVLHKL